jgi:hypothetical protein
MSRIYAPWKDDQVESLNACQNDGSFQIWTRRDKRSPGRLVATREGWIDPQTQEVVQAWAQDLMTDWEWLDMKLGMERLLGSACD